MGVGTHRPSLGSDRRLRRLNWSSLEA